MAYDVHVAYISPMSTLNSNVINKNTATIKEVLNSEMEMRIVADDSLSNSLNNPTIEEYLILEEGDMFYLQYMSNTCMVTYAVI